MRKEKRTERVMTNLRPTFKQALDLMAAHERRTISGVIEGVLERDPHVRIFLQQVGVPQTNS